MQFVAAKDVREGMYVSADVRDDQGRTLIARGQRMALLQVTAAPQTALR